jgi:hypothetical protein
MFAENYIMVYQFEDVSMKVCMLTVYQVRLLLFCDLWSTPSLPNTGVFFQGTKNSGRFHDSFN